MNVTTRTFFLVKDGTRKFLELSWSGLELEAVTGKVGSAGRASAQRFESEKERDAWLAKRVAKALKEGYVEGNPADVPVPEPVDEDALRIERLRKKHATPTFVPVYAAGDDAPDRAKLGGTPWLADAWPVCPACTKPLQFVLQLRREAVPASCRWAFREELIQLFLCDWQGKPGVPRWLCQADGEGWKPFAPSTLVQHVPLRGESRAIEAALPFALREHVARLEHAGLDAYGQQAGDPPLPAPAPEAIAARAEALARVPADDQAFYLGQSFVYPPQPITGWEERVDFPSALELETDDDDLELECYGRDKLAGAPAWAQRPEVPSCRSCRTAMRFVYQIATRGPISIGGDGIGWLFVCERCKDATFTWQR